MYFIFSLYILFQGPISEEFIFRSCMVSVCYMANFSNTFMIFVLPLFFGVAHVHHAYEQYSLYKNEENIIIQIVFSIGILFKQLYIINFYSIYS